MQSATRTVRCPTCGKAVEWRAENRFRPFCSERCKTTDLGAWAAEQYRVPVSEDQTDSQTDPKPEA